MSQKKSKNNIYNVFCKLQLALKLVENECKKGKVLMFCLAGFPVLEIVRRMTKSDDEVEWRGVGNS